MAISRKTLIPPTGRKDVEKKQGFYCRKEKDRKKDETARHRDDEETENYGLKTKKEQERKEKNGDKGRKGETN